MHLIITQICELADILSRDIILLSPGHTSEASNNLSYHLFSSYLVLDPVLTLMPTMSYLIHTVTFWGR